MGNILSEVIINNEIIGLSIVLVILGKALKDSQCIPNYLILWILIIISLILNLISSFTVASIIEGFIAVSLANTYHQTYKQTKKMATSIRKRRG